jgi:MFS superfamily sulfate permease-like transporter
MEGSALLLPRLQRWMPGLHLLKTYESSNFRGDLVAGVSVAAVAIPIGIALAAILMVSAIGLFDIKSVVSFYKTSKPEFRHSVVATLGVMTVGILPGILVAVGLALMKLLMLASRPHAAELGMVPGEPDFHNLETTPNARPIPGLIIYRFDASIVFFNAEYFQSRVRAVIAAAKEKPKWFLYDSEAAAVLDITGGEVLKSLQAELEAKGIVFGIARSKGWFKTMLHRTGVVECVGQDYIFPTVTAGVAAYQRQLEGRNDLEVEAK